MQNWARVLELLDSHERPILLRWASDHPLRLGDHVRREISGLLPQGTDVPADAFVAMDYTLDWLYAASQIYLSGTPYEAKKPRLRPTADELTASVEDVDLLIAWDDGTPHTVLLEAKGFTAFTNGPMQRKVKRLADIFDAGKAESFDLHFILVGPKRSLGLKTDDWPPWTGKLGRRHFLEIPDPGTRLAVQRCTETGKPTQTDWTHWQLIERRWASGKSEGAALLPTSDD